MNWTGGARFRNSRESHERERQKEYFSQKRNVIKKQPVDNEALNFDPASESMDLMYLNLMSSFNDEGKVKPRCRSSSATIRRVNLDTPHCRSARFPKTVHLGSSPEEIPSRLKLDGEPSDQDGKPNTRNLYTSQEECSAAVSNKTRARSPPETIHAPQWMGLNSTSEDNRNHERLCNGNLRQGKATTPNHQQGKKKPFITTPMEVKAEFASSSGNIPKPEVSRNTPKPLRPIKNYLFERMVGVLDGKTSRPAALHAENQTEHLAMRRVADLDHTVMVPKIAQIPVGCVISRTSRGSGWHDFISGKHVEPPSLDHKEETVLQKEGQSMERIQTQTEDQQIAIDECFAASRNEEVEPVCFQSTQQRYDFEVSCETPGSKIKEAFEEVMGNFSEEQLDSLSDYCDGESTCSLDLNLHSANGSWHENPAPILEEVVISCRTAEDCCGKEKDTSSNILCDQASCSGLDEECPVAKCDDPVSPRSRAPMVQEDCLGTLQNSRKTSLTSSPCSPTSLETQPPQHFSPEKTNTTNVLSETSDSPKHRECCVKASCVADNTTSTTAKTKVEYLDMRAGAPTLSTFDCRIVALQDSARESVEPSQGDISPHSSLGRKSYSPECQLIATAGTALPSNEMCEENGEQASGSNASGLEPSAIDMNIALTDSMHQEAPVRQGQRVQHILVADNAPPDTIPLGSAPHATDHLPQDKQQSKAHRTMSLDVKAHEELQLYDALANGIKSDSSSSSFQCESGLQSIENGKSSAEIRQVSPEQVRWEANHSARDAVPKRDQSDAAHNTPPRSPLTCSVMHSLKPPCNSPGCTVSLGLTSFKCCRSARRSVGHHCECCRSALLLLGHLQDRVSELESVIKQH